MKKVTLKTYLLALGFSLLFGHFAQAATVKTPCNLTLLVKKIDAKTAYLSTGDTVSKSMRAKLEPVCTLKVELMSSSMIKEMKIKKLKKQLEKLSTK